jgi:hypothetical protein
MFPDQAWDTALQNWQPTGSFHEVLPTPVHGPADGTLVQLPCINQEWVLLLMGCLTQLQNPVIWGSISDSIRDQVLSWVTQLQEMMWGGMDVPCCNVQMRLTADCGLQFSVDGGSTWVPVTGWVDNFCTCAVSCIIAPVPPNPGPTLTQQHACNIAGFLANDIIKVAMEKIVSYVGTTNEQVQFATDVLSTISFAFPITYAASLAFRDWYNSVVGQVLAQVEAARDDPVLWADVTCAIYNAIKSVGYVTAGNFAAVATNLGAISYTYAWVPPVLAAWWNDMGLHNIQAAQSVGALDDVDCSGCGSWCNEWDLTSAAGPWFVPAGEDGHYSPGVGFVGANDGASNECDIVFNFGANLVITQIYMEANSTRNDTHGNGFLMLGTGSAWPSGSNCDQVFGSPNVGAFNETYNNPACSPGGWVWVRASNDVGAGPPIAITKVRLRGRGPNPFAGSDNCT